ncbi:MAG: class I SAM-dependent methyltransferase [Aestuariibacter sp.]|nr:class I SAM-dependent methyltransferase [Aestuariibacter sp.]
MTRRQKRDFSNALGMSDTTQPTNESASKSRRRKRRDYSQVTSDGKSTSKLSGTLSLSKGGSVVDIADRAAETKRKQSKLSPAEARALKLKEAERHTSERRENFELLDPKRYVTADNNIWIGKEDWADLKKRYNNSDERSRLIRLLEGIVIDHKMSLPTREVSRDAAWESFLELKRADSAPFMAGARTDSRFTYKQPLGMLTVLANNVGNFTGDYFYQDIRWTCRGSFADSPAESWKDRKALRSIFHRLIDDEADMVSRDTLRKFMGVRQYIPTPDRPFVAKALLDYFKPDSVLDLSVGWGSRLLGFEAAEHPTEYHGIDPDQRIVEASRKLDKFCRQTRKNVNIYKEAAEDFAYEIIDPVDMIMFAPPPYNNERYSKDDTQAYIRYPTVDEFLDNFLKTTLVKAWESLKVGGTLVVELGDLKAPKFDDFGGRTGGRYRLVEPLMSIIKRELDGAEYMGTIGSGIASNKPSSKLDTTLRGDPIWVFKKKGSQRVASILFGNKMASEVYSNLNP